MSGISGNFFEIDVVQFGDEVDGYTVRSFQLNPCWG